MVPVKEGEVLAGKYRVDRVLGAGGMGVVVLATHIALEQQVALKFLLPASLANDEMAGRFLREARAAVKLKSEHVAKVLDVGTMDDGAPYIVMEYLHGRDLDSHLATRGPLPTHEIAEIVIQACDAIAEAHALGIVHRDLKPANLFLTQRADGTPLIKVLDFGISKSNALNDRHDPLTKTSSVMGSPSYMSPEQMKSARDVDARADIWSLGVIMFQLATTRLPFDAETLGGLMSKVLQERPDPIGAYRPDLPPGFQSIVMRCLERDRERRFLHVGELATALAPFGPSRMTPVIERIASLAGGICAPSDGTSMSTSAANAATPLPRRGSGTDIAPPHPSAMSFQASQPAWHTSQSATAAAPKRAGVIGAAIVAIVVMAGLPAAGVIMYYRKANPTNAAVATTEPPPSGREAPPASTVPPVPVTSEAPIAEPPPATHAAADATASNKTSRTVPAPPKPAAPVRALPTAPTPTAQPAPKKPGIMDTPE